MSLRLTDRMVNGVGFRLTIASGSVSEKVEKAIRDGLPEVAKAYLEKIKKNISLDDHDLAELRRLGHPYAVHREKGVAPVHSDDRLVHVQTGKLRDSIKASIVQESGRKYSVVISSDAPHLPYLIFGTERMRPRRFHEKAFEDMGIHLWNPVTKLLRDIKHKLKTLIKL